MREEGLTKEMSVSYTHLDVYKRQVPGFQCGAGGRRLQNNGIGLQGGIVADIILSLIHI